MFENLEEFCKGEATLKVDANGLPSKRELQICTAVLLIKMAHADEVLDSSEVDAAVSCLDRQFLLLDHEAGDILEVADYLRRNREKLDQFIEAINQGFEDSQKITVLAMACKVMKADGSVTLKEAALASEIAVGLGLSKSEVEKAIKMAEDGEV